MTEPLQDAALRAIVDNSAHPYAVVTFDGTVTYASESVAGLVGWAAEDLVGRNMAEFIRPEDLALAIEAITEIELFDRAGAGVPMIFGLLRPDGGTAWVEIGAMPMLDRPDVQGIVLRLRPYEAEHALDGFVARLLADEPLADVLVALCGSLAPALASDAAAVHFGFDGRAFEGAAGFGIDAAALPLDAGPWCDAVTSGKPCHRGVTMLDATVARHVGPLRACWTVPVTPHGIAPAALSVWRVAGGAPLLGHRRGLERAVRYVELALVRTAEHRRLRHLAGHDALTGVANRSAFRDRLATALAIGETDLAVAFCDLDGFKAVNDTWGHAAGDDVLVAVADRLRRQLRAGDEIARLGGDEFTVLLRNVADARAAEEVGQRLHDAVRQPFPVAGEEAKIGLSVGIVLSTPGATADALIAGADAALYAVKRRGGDGTLVTTPPTASVGT